MRTLQSELEHKVERPVGESRPRCVCHGKYVSVNSKQPDPRKLCPASAAYVAEPVRLLVVPEAAAKVNVTPPRARWYRCTKVGHESQGKAEAAKRSVERRIENGSLHADWKADQRLEVYRCRRPECQAKPWHVGHKRDGETPSLVDSNQS